MGYVHIWCHFVVYFSEWAMFILGAILLCISVNGLWSEWSEYSACSLTCGGGYYSRNRTCIFEDDAPHGSECFGNDTQTDACNGEACPGRFSCIHSVLYFFFSLDHYIGSLSPFTHANCLV